MADGVFNIGIVGVGGISGAHIGAAKASEGRVQVVAVADVDGAAANKAAADTNAQAFSSLDAMLKAHKSGEIKLDGVVICTPPSIRLKLVDAALKAKMPVLMEKPIAHTLADAKKLAALSLKHKKVPAFLAYCHRFAAPINVMKRLVADGKVGRLVRIENAFACDLPGHESKWFSDPKKAGGGALLDMGSHSLDLFAYLTGGPAKTIGAVLDFKWKKRTETASTILVQSTKKANSNVPAGVSGVIVSGWAETSRFTLNLVGDAGMLSYDYEKPNELIFKDLVGKPEVHTVDSHDTRFRHQLVAFADAVQNKTKSQLATFADGLAASAADAKARKK
jgi:predicted dehydrogenase